MNRNELYANTNTARISVNKLNEDDFNRADDYEDDIDSQYKPVPFPLLDQMPFSVRNSHTQIGLMLRHPPQSSTNLSEKLSSPEKIPEPVTIL